MKKLSVLMLCSLAACDTVTSSEGPQAGPKAEVQARADAAPLRTSDEMKSISAGLAKEKAWDFDGAQAAYEEALQTDPKNDIAALALARMLVRAGKAELAERTLITVRKQVGDKAEVLNGLSSVARSRKKTADAIAYAKIVLLRDQANVDALNNIALAYLADGKLDSAELYIQTALKRSSGKDTSSLLVTMGMIQLKRGDAQKAMAYFQQAPNSPVARANAGFLALQYRDYALAAFELDGALKAGFGGKDVSAAKCYALEGLQKGPEAAACLQGLSELLTSNDAELAPVLYSLGMVHQNLTRDRVKALVAFRRYVDVKGNSLSKNDRVPDMIKKLENQKATAEEPSDENPSTKAEAKPASARSSKKTSRRA